MERLAGSAWHELAQPLTGLSGLLSLARMEGPDEGDPVVEPELVAAAVAVIRRLTRALTDLARGSERPAGLRELVEDVTALARYDLAGVEVVIDVPPDAPEPGMSPAALRLVAASLVVDAVDALRPEPAALDPEPPAPRHLRWSAPSAVPAGGALPEAGAPRARLVLEHDGRTGAPGSIGLLRELMRRGGGDLEHEQPAARGSRSILSVPV